MRSRLCRRGGAPGSASAGRGSGPRAPASAAIPSFPLSLLRLHFPDAWLRAGPRFSAFVSPRLEAGEGAHCPDGALFAGGKGVSHGSPPGRGSPGRGRRRAGVARGAARRRPPFWPQVGGARRLCSESGLRPVGPSPHAHFLLPVSLLGTRVASGTPTGPPWLPWGPWGVGFWDLN